MIKCNYCQKEKEDVVEITYTIDADGILYPSPPAFLCENCIEIFKVWGCKFNYE